MSPWVMGQFWGNGSMGNGYFGGTAPGGPPPHPLQSLLTRAPGLTMDSIFRWTQTASDGTGHVRIPVAAAGAVSAAPDHTSGVMGRVAVLRRTGVGEED